MSGKDLVEQMISKKIAKMREANVASKKEKTAQEVVFEFFDEVEKLNAKLTEKDDEMSIRFLLSNAIQYLDESIKLFDKNAKVTVLWRTDVVERVNAVRILWSTSYASFHNVSREITIDIADLIFREAK